MDTNELNELRAARKLLVIASRDANDDLADARERAFQRDMGFGSVRAATLKAEAAYAACVAFDAAHPELIAIIVAEQKAKRSSMNVWG